MICAGLQDMKFSHILNHFTLITWAEVMTSYLLYVHTGKTI